MAHIDKKGIIDELWRGERRCIGPRAKDADLGKKCIEFIKKAYW